ncbi:MAG: M14 family zinc carboxypeptidase [Spirochaetia bacterium]
MNRMQGEYAFYTGARRISRALFFVLVFPLLAAGCGIILDEPETLSTLGEKFHTPGEIGSYFETMENRYPGIAGRGILSFTEEADSVIHVLTITDNPGIDEDEPEIQVAGGIHGNEEASVELCLYLINRLLMGYTKREKKITELVEGAEIRIMPLVNPRGFLAGTRENPDGVDLNRNFSWGWGQTNDSGPEPFSEPETRALRDDALANRYNLHVNIHTGAEGLAIPWDYIGTTESLGQPETYTIEEYEEQYAPGYPLLYRWGESYRNRARENGMAAFFLLQGYDWYPAYGTWMDWVRGERGTNSFTLEISRYKNFESGDEAILDELWEIHGEPLLDLISRGVAEGIHGSITDQAGNPVSARITAVPAAEDRGLGPDPVPWQIFTETDPDRGDYHLYLPEGRWRILAEAEGFMFPDAPSVTVETGVRYDGVDIQAE